MGSGSLNGMTEMRKRKRANRIGSRQRKVSPVNKREREKEKASEGEEVHRGSRKYLDSVSDVGGR